MDNLNINPWMKKYCINSNNHLLKLIENLYNYNSKSIKTQKYLSSVKDAQLLIYFYNNSENRNNIKYIFTINSYYERYL